jgi:hypothetical protein
MDNKHDYITEEMLEIYDLDWFAVDPIGNIANFASAGVGFIPESMRISDAKRVMLLNYFTKNKEISRSIRVKIKPSNLSVRDYYSSFDRMSKRGLFSFCFPIMSEAIQKYEIFTKPLTPLNIDDIPRELSEHLSKTRLNVMLTDVNNIDLNDFLEL